MAIPIMIPNIFDFVTRLAFASGASRPVEPASLVPLKAWRTGRVERTALSFSPADSTSSQ